MEGMHSGHLASDGVGLGHSDRAENPHTELEGVTHADDESTTESALCYDARGNCG